MVANQAFGSVEIIQIADAVAREKNIDREIIIDAMAQSIEVAARRKYGADQNIKAEIDSKTGEIQLFRITEIVEEFLENEDGELEMVGRMLLKEAKKLDKTLEIGSEIKDELPPIDFGRIAAQTAKQVIVQKVRDAERERQYEEYKDRVGEIISGTVKRVDYGNIIVDMGNGEAYIRRDEVIPRERFRTNERIRAYLYDVKREQSGPQIFLSRTCPEFMEKLFASEVPEIYDGVIEIKAIARDPGSRAKIAVSSNDYSVNPVLSCVGVRGARVQSVVAELQGEKVDIIEYSADTATFVVNAVSSAEVSKVIIDEDNDRIEIVVPDDQLSLAIGRRGQNVRLASQLIGWSIDILTEEIESERRTQEFHKLSEMFVSALNVEEVIAHLLVTEGFSMVEEVAYVPVEDLAAIDGFDADVAEELRQRAADWLESTGEETRAKIKELGIKDDLVSLEGVENELLIKLGEAGVKTRDDLADLAADEFAEMIPESGMNEDKINQLIMKARAHWFADEEAEAGAETKSEDKADDEKKEAKSA